MPLARGRAVFVDKAHGAADHRLGKFAGVGDRGRTADEGRPGTVKAADALQAANDVGKVRAKYAAIGVNFVDDHILEIFKKLDPFGVVRQNALMQHVRIGNHHMARLADGRARRGGRISVVGIGLDRRAHILDEGVQFRGLIAGKRLCGKDVEGAIGLVLQNGVENGHVVAERLARGRGRDHHAILPRQRRLDGAALMDVGTLNAPAGERRDKARV